MAEELPSLHIDDDWKKQAQEEKKRLAEEQQKRQAQQPPKAVVAPPGLSSVAAPAGSAPARGRARGVRELPPPGFPSLVQTLLTQALFYLGELAPAGGEGSIDLDRAKHQIDTLGVLEEKTANNLTEDEKRILDSALYETRARFVNVATQFI